MKKLFFSLFIALALCSPAYAADFSDSFGLDGIELAVPESAKEVMEGIRADNAELNYGLDRLWAFLVQHLSDAVKAAVRPVATVLIIVIVCSLAEGFADKGGFDYVSFGGCTAVALTAVGDVNSVMAMGENTLYEISAFSNALLPGLATISAASGSISSASAKYAAAAIFLDILLRCAVKLIFPVICGYTACIIAGAAVGDRRLDAPAALMKRLSTLFMTALVTAFTAYLSISGTVAAGADAAAAKTAKAVISTALPVVGRLISNASESIVAGAGLIRNAAGVFGMLTVASSCLLPVLNLGIRYLLFKAASSIASAVAGDRLGRLIDGLGSVYGMVLGLVGTGAVFMFLSILSLIKVVS